MKKILITAVALALAVPALAAQQDIAQLSAVTASREALRTAVNTQLAAVQANFDEVYAVIEAGPVYVNASAPADTKVVWIDTDQSNAIKVYVGGAWTVVGSGGEGSGDDLGSAAYTDVVALWTACTGYLKSDGTCDTPSGSATYPSAAGVANWNGSAWGTSYTVGTAANNLVQLNASAQLPAVSGALLTVNASGFDGNLATTDNTLQEIAQKVDDLAVAGLTSLPTADNQLIQATGSGTYAWTSTLEGIGNITGGTYNKITVTPPATGATLTLAEGSTLATSGAYSTTLTATGATNVTLPTSGTLLSTADVDDTPVNGVTAAPVSSNWAYDHVAAADPHTGYVLESAIGTTVQAYDADLTAWAGITPSTGNLETTGTIQGNVVFNSYTAAQTLTYADHNASIVQMTTADEVTMWDCETAGIGATVMLWARDAEKIEVVPASGDHFVKFDGTALIAGNELDMAAIAGTKVTLMCTADDTWSVYSETAACTDGGAAD